MEIKLKSVQRKGLRGGEDWKEWDGQIMDEDEGWDKKGL